MKKQVLIFTAIFFALFFIITNYSEAQRRDRTGSTGNDGSSFEKAVVINAASEMKGVPAENEWLNSHYPGHKLKSQKLAMHNDKSYDLLTIITAKGEEKTIYFDISNFFGKF